MKNLDLGKDVWGQQSGDAEGCSVKSVPGQTGRYFPI